MRSFRQEFEALAQQHDICLCPRKATCDRANSDMGEKYGDCMLDSGCLKNCSELAKWKLGNIPIILTPRVFSAPTCSQSFKLLSKVPEVSTNKDWFRRAALENLPWSITSGCDCRQSSGEV